MASTESATAVCDFANSYVTFTVADGHNTARIQVDAICRLTGETGPGQKEFFLITPCKSEHMYAERGLFQDPNFDFCGIFSRDEYLILRSFAVHDPARAIETDAGVSGERFAEVLIDVTPHGASRPLKTEREVFDATLANEQIVARTHFSDPATGRGAVVEYPVKTMNVAKPTGRFQTDTGPILVPRWLSDRAEKDAPPDPGRRPGTRAVEQFVMAFVSCNRFTGGDLVLRVPTPVEASGRLVWHYSRLLPIPDARHEFFAVPTLR